MHTNPQSENLTGRGHLGDLGIDGRIILKTIMNRIWWCGMDASVAGYGPVPVSCDQGNEPCSLIRGQEFTD